MHRRGILPSESQLGQCKRAIDTYIADTGEFTFQEAAERVPNMTLRDYVAIHSDMTKVEPMEMSIATKLLGTAMPHGLIESTMWRFELVWRLRYMSADAMLAVRERDRGG